MDLIDLSTKSKKYVPNTNRKSDAADVTDGEIEILSGGELQEKTQNTADEEIVLSSWNPSPQIHSTKRRNSVSPMHEPIAQRFHGSFESDDDLFIADLDFLG